MLRLGNRIRSEANILGQGLLGTPDLSCGSLSRALIATSSVAGHCTRDVVSYGLEMAGAYGPMDFQAEYLGTNYNRNMNKILLARASGIFAPGGASQFFSGYYVYGQYWLTGEERAASYEVKDRNSANFGEPKIKNPVSAGGFGAVALLGRFSELNLDSGPYSGTGLANLMALTTWVRPNPVAQTVVQNAGVARRTPGKYHHRPELVPGEGHPSPVQLDPCAACFRAAQRLSIAERRRALRERFPARPPGLLHERRKPGHLRGARASLLVSARQRLRRDAAPAGISCGRRFFAPADARGDARSRHAQDRTMVRAECWVRGAECGAGKWRPTQTGGAVSGAIVTPRMETGLTGEVYCAATNAYV